MKNQQAKALAQNVLLVAVTAGALWSAATVLHLPWLSQPWRDLWATLAALWS